MIDWSRVRELRDEVGAEDFDEVVEIFLEEVEEIIEKLATAPSLASLEEDLHFLKGSAMSFGFVAFSRLCHDGELKSAAGQADQVDLAAVIDGFRNARSEFTSHLTQQLAA